MVLGKSIQLYVNAIADFIPEIWKSEARGVKVAKVSLWFFAQPSISHRRMQEVIIFSTYFMKGSLHDEFDQRVWVFTTCAQQ